MTKVRGIPPKLKKTNINIHLIKNGVIVQLENGAEYVVIDRHFDATAHTAGELTPCFACNYTRNLPPEQFKDNVTNRLFRHSDFKHHYDSLPPVVRILND